MAGLNLLPMTIALNLPDRSLIKLFYLLTLLERSVLQFSSTYLFYNRIWVKQYDHDHYCPESPADLEDCSTDGSWHSTKTTESPADLEDYSPIVKHVDFALATDLDSFPMIYRRSYLHLDSDPPDSTVLESESIRSTGRIGLVWDFPSIPGA